MSWTKLVKELCSYKKEIEEDGHQFAGLLMKFKGDEYIVTLLREMHLYSKRIQANLLSLFAQIRSYSMVFSMAFMDYVKLTQSFDAVHNEIFDLGASVCSHVEST